MENIACGAASGFCIGIISPLLPLAYWMGCFTCKYSVEEDNNKIKLTRHINFKMPEKNND